MDKLKFYNKKILAGTIIFIGSLLIIYLSMSMYFLGHFHFRSSINNINISGKSVKVADNKIIEEMGKYTLHLDERGGIKEDIKADEIGLKYNVHDKVEELKKQQSPFSWIPRIFSKKNYTLSEVVQYDENLLKERINNLSCFNADNIVEPKSPSFKYSDGKYEVVGEVNGNKVNKDILYNQIVNSILKGKTKINLEEMNCYEKPQYTLESKEVNAAVNDLNKYISSKITYTFGQRTDVLDGFTISSWLNISDNMEVSFDEEKVRSYIDTMADKYDTYGITRDFNTSLGASIKVYGGNYGWQINRYDEVQDLIAVIKDGKTTTKEPLYMQVAAVNDTNDTGNTYVEIDLTKQHLWFYKGGTLITQGDVVTGNVSKNTSTPQGTYRLMYKQKDATLKGEDYNTPVSFWMPFNGGIGIHDATWRPAFGGEIYQTDGSHGCVNAPYDLAETIFNNIDSGTAVIVHY